MAQSASYFDGFLCAGLCPEATSDCCVRDAKPILTQIVVWVKATKKSRRSGTFLLKTSITLAYGNFTTLSVVCLSEVETFKR